MRWTSWVFISLIGIVAGRGGTPLYAQGVPLTDAAKAQYEQAVSAQESGNLDQAIESYRQVLKTDPKHAPSYANLGLVYIQQGKLDDAIKSYQKALELAPDDEDARYNLGTVYYQRKKYDEAIETLRWGLDRSPDRDDLRLNLGNAYLKKGKLADAIREYQEAIRIKPDAPAPYYNLALVYARQKAADKVLDQLQAYVQRAQGADDVETVKQWIEQLGGGQGQ